MNKKTTPFLKETQNILKIIKTGHPLSATGPELSQKMLMKRVNLFGEKNSKFQLYFQFFFHLKTQFICLVRGEICVLVFLCVWTKLTLLDSFF